jgi:hypothetical protein
MAHPLVAQLRFTRSEFRRGLEGVTEAEARRRFLPMNCIGWNVGHLAWQEQRYWLTLAQDIVLLPDIQKQFAYGAPASRPSIAKTLEAWQVITSAADPWLDRLTSSELERHVARSWDPQVITFGALLQRVIYHYWYHLGENLAIRQMLGHADLPEFVGNIDDEAPYRPNHPNLATRG